MNLVACKSFFISKFVIPSVVVSLAISPLEDNSNFSGHQQATTPSLTFASMMANTNKAPRSKTIYLIRHAESLENVAYQGARRVQASYASKQVPEWSDILDALKLTYKMFRPTVMNAALSDLGRNQVRQLHENLKKDRFLVDDNERHFTIVHSPLQRAKQTAYGSMFGPAHMDDASPPNEKDYQPCLQLESLREVNPTEIIRDALLFYKEKAVDQRIREFENWIESRDEESLVVVGHSVYFKRMLNLPEAFNNCDVWGLEYSLVNAKGIEDPQRTVTTPMSKGGAKTFNLPRKWTSIRRLYTYSPEQIPEIDEEATNTE